MIKNKQGISLIVLVITIIVMIILAATVVISLSNTNIINRANTAVGSSNEKQMQTAAITIWADAYMEGSRGDELADKVKEGLLALDKDYATKYDVTITDNNVSLKTKEEGWIVLLSEAVTSENAIISLGATFDIDNKSKYKLLVESDEYIGEIDSKLMLVTQETDGTTKYLVGVVTEGKLLEYNGLIDLNVKIKELENNNKQYTTIILVYGEVDGEKNCVLWFNQATCEYTVKKIKKKEIKVNSANKQVITPVVEVENVSYNLANINLDVTKKYVLEYNDGYHEIAYDCPVAGNRAVFWGDVIGLIDYDNNEMLLIYTSPIDGDVIVHEVGVNENVKKENEHILAYRNSKWTYVQGTRIPPKSVAGQTVEAVSTLVTDLYYDGATELIIETDSFFGELTAKIEVASSAKPEDVYNAVTNCKSDTIMSLVLDMTSFEDLTIPVEVINKATCIYVNSTVKEKYQDYEKVKVKEE